MGFFDKPSFDFNGDGKEDVFETCMGLQMMAGSRKEAIELTGDDTFYLGSDTIEEEVEEQTDTFGLNFDDLACMDASERREAIEEAGFDPDDFDDDL